MSATSPIGTYTDGGGTGLIPDPRQQPTMSIEEAAGVLGVGRDAGYAAARSGELPVIRVGGRIRVPTARLLALLGYQAPAQ